MSTEVIEAPAMPILLPSMKEWEQILGGGGIGGPYVVIVYNDDWHTFEQVIKQLCKATSCSPEKAWEIANEIHTKGRAIAYAGSQEECERVANILREIRLQVETDKSV